MGLALAMVLVPYLSPVTSRFLDSVQALFVPFFNSMVPEGPAAVTQVTDVSVGGDSDINDWGCLNGGKKVDEQNPAP